MDVRIWIVELSGRPNSVDDAWLTSRGGLYFQLIVRQLVGWLVDVRVALHEWAPGPSTTTSSLLMSCLVRLDKTIPKAKKGRSAGGSARANRGASKVTRTGLYVHSIIH